MKKIFYLVITLLVTQISLQEVNAQKIPFQGRLFENGQPITKTVTLEFSIEGTTWVETHSNVSVSDGLYSVDLGTKTPIPSTLFFGVDSRMLAIKVNGTSLSSIAIYPSLSGNNFVMEIDGAPEGKDAVSYTITGVGTADKLYRPFVGTSSVSKGINGGVTGIGTSLQGNTNNAYGLYGIASGDGSGTHYGLFATSTGTHPNYGAFTSATGDGKFNTGIRGLASGAGDGSTGYGTGSYNTGVQGFARSNSWGNTGVWGYVYNDPVLGGVGVDNIGVVGRSEVNNGAPTMSNIGVKGDAWGSGINKGVFGTAKNGVENWAGWFEGDVRTTGQLIVDGLLRVNDNFFVKNLVSVDGKNFLPVIQTGLKTWESDSLNNGYLWLKGMNPNGTLSEGLFMDANSYNNGNANVMEGRIILKRFENSNSVGEKLLTYGYFNDMENRLNNIEFNSFYLPANVSITRASYDDAGIIQYGGEIALSRTTGTGIRLQNFDAKGGHIALDGTDGNFVYLWGSGSVDVSSKVSLRKAQGLDDEFSGNITIQGHESPNIIMGGSENSDMDLPFFSLYGNQPDGNDWFHHHINLTVEKDGDQQWGTLRLNGNNGNENIVMGGKSWEGPTGANRAFLRMRGQDANKDLVFMDVRDDGKGGELGFVNFSRTSGEFIDIDSRKINLNNKVVLDADTLGNGQINVNGQSGTKLRMYGHLANDNTSHMALDGADGNFVYLWGNGSVDVSNKVSLRKQEGSEEFAGNVSIWGHESPNFILQGKHWNDMDLPNMSILGNQPNGNGWFHEHINLQVQKDGSQQWGELSLKGSNGNENIVMGGKSWEGTTGANRAFLRMRGQDTNKDLIFMDVRNGSNGEYGGMTFFGAGSENTFIDSRMVGVKNGRVLLDADTLGSGQIHVNSQSGTALRMYAHFDNDNTSHIALDGTGGNYLYLWGQGNINASGTISANVLVSSNGTVQSSDARLKKNILGLQGSLNKTNQLRGVSYNWIDPKKSETRQIGLIAQEVEAVYPELVQTLTDGTKAVNYSQLVAVLIESIKELSQKVETLEVQNNDLKASLQSQDELKHEMSLLKALVLEAMSQQPQEETKSVATKISNN